MMYIRILKAKNSTGAILMIIYASLKLKLLTLAVGSLFRSTGQITVKSFFTDLSSFQGLSIVTLTQYRINPYWPSKEEGEVVGMRN